MTKILFVAISLVVLVNCSSSGRGSSNCPSECRRQYSQPDKVNQCVNMCR